MGLLWRLPGASQTFHKKYLCACVRDGRVFRLCTQVLIHTVMLACTFALGFCESFCVENGGGGGIMSASVFPSVTMKDVDWGHIELRSSRNIKGPPRVIFCVFTVLTVLFPHSSKPSVRPQGRICVWIWLTLSSTYSMLGGDVASKGKLYPSF